MKYFICTMIILITLCNARIGVGGLSGPGMPLSRKSGGGYSKSNQDSQVNNNIKSREIIVNINNNITYKYYDYYENHPIFCIDCNEQLGVYSFIINGNGLDFRGSWDDNIFDNIYYCNNCKYWGFFNVEYNISSYGRTVKEAFINLINNQRSEGYKKKLYQPDIINLSKTVYKNKND